MPLEWLFTIWPVEWGITRELGWRNALDITLMTFLVYHSYIRMRGTRAARIAAGMALLGVGYFLAQAAGLLLTSWVLGGIWAVVFILVIVVFQTEIRQIVEYLNLMIPSWAAFRRTVWAPETINVLTTIAETCCSLAGKRCGALLVFERSDPLEPLLRSQGSLVDARISAQLLETLFTQTTPLHDGALYLREERIYRAGCILPLSETRTLPYFYGTRHRAAIGITERSDALALVVSEEHGTVAVVERGGMVIQPGPQELVTWLTPRLLSPAEKRQWRWSVRTFLTHNWRAKLGAFAAVMILWLILVGPQNTEVGFTIPVVYYNIPANLDLESKRTQEVYLRLRGSREFLRLLDPGHLRAQVDLKEAREGPMRYSLSATDVNVPLGVQVAGVDPPTMTVHLRRSRHHKNRARRMVRPKTESQKKTMEHESFKNAWPAKNGDLMPINVQQEPWEYLAKLLKTGNGRAL